MTYNANMIQINKYKLLVFCGKARSNCEVTEKNNTVKSDDYSRVYEPNINYTSF